MLVGAIWGFAAPLRMDYNKKWFISYIFKIKRKIQSIKSTVKLAQE